MFTSSLIFWNTWLYHTRIMCGQSISFVSLYDLHIDIIYHLRVEIKLHGDPENQFTL